MQTFYHYHYIQKLKKKGARNCKKASFSKNPISTALCSRYFQNVKLSLGFVGIWSCYLHSNFTWNPILANSNSPKMTLNFDFFKFEQLSSPKFAKNSKIRVSKIAKNDVFGLFEFAKNLISRKIGVAVKLINFNKVKP